MPETGFDPCRRLERSPFLVDSKVPESPVCQSRGLSPAPDGTENLALGRPALQSSVSAWSRRPKSPAPGLLGALISAARADAEGGNNGQITGNFGFHTEKERESWWQVDLGRVCHIQEIRVFNRLGDESGRATRLAILDSVDGSSWQKMYQLGWSDFGGWDGEPLMVRLSEPICARYVRLILPRIDFLHLDEVEIYGA